MPGNFEGGDKGGLEPFGKTAPAEGVKESVDLGNPGGDEPKPQIVAGGPDMDLEGDPNATGPRAQFSIRKKS